MPKSVNTEFIPIVRPRTKRPKPYKTKPMEMRGEQKNETRAIKSFWKEYTMDQVMVMSSEELDKAIDGYLEAFAARQIKQNKLWWYPESPKDNWGKLRNHPTVGKHKFN